MEQCLSSVEWIDEYLQWAAPDGAAANYTVPRSSAAPQALADPRFADAYLEWIDARRASVPERVPNRVEQQPLDALRDALLFATAVALEEVKRSAPDTVPQVEREIDWPHTLEAMAAQLRARYGETGAERARV